MIRRVLAALVLAGAFSVAAPAPVLAQADVVAVSTLIDEPAAHAGQRVTVEGELIGDYGFRSNGYMWTQLNDDAYAWQPLVDSGALSGGNIGIGVRMPEELAADLDPPGGYRRRGPIVRLSGEFRYHDPGRQGETYIAVDSLVVVEGGFGLAERIDLVPTLAGCVLLGLAVGLQLLHRRRSRVT